MLEAFAQGFYCRKILALVERKLYILYTEGTLPPT